MAHRKNTKCGRVFGRIFSQRTQVFRLKIKSNSTRKHIFVDTFGVAVARHGLILWQNEATGSRKVFRYLRGLREAVQNSKMAAKVQQCRNAVFYRILYINSRSTASAATSIEDASPWTNAAPLFEQERITLEKDRVPPSLAERGGFIEKSTKAGSTKPEADV